MLLRFGDVDPNKGELTGASLTQITQLTRDGVPINTTLNPPEQLALLESEPGQKLSDVLGEVNAQTIIKNQTLSSALAVEQDQVSALDADLTEAHQRADTLADQLTAAKPEIARLIGSLNAEDIAGSSIIAKAKK
ncbi:hypothetical protein AO263_25995 [Pseudomonas sp. NZIPFR-PS5]|nr:hypothetical protein AO263_25995 [Pseudomonas sp. NZIPFR-PS5]